MKPQELISKYIQNNLTPEEQKEFDTLIVTDTDFKKEVAFHEDIKKAAENKDDDNFRALLTDLESNVKQKNSPTWWYVAASIVILLGATYFFSLKKPVSNEELFAVYFEPYRNITQPVARGEELENLKTIAFNAYENGNFEKALTLFDTLLSHKEESSILFYKANVLLKLNDAKKAITILEKKAIVKDSFSEKIYWYLALSYLKDNDPEKSKEKLKLVLKVPNSDYKKEEARKLLEALD